MGISLAAINQKLRAYENSSAGKAAINRKIHQYQKEGTSTTQAGSRVLTAAEVSALANDFISILQSKAGSSTGNGGSGSIPPSVSAHLSNLTAGTPVEIADGYFSVTISFGDDLSRSSLRKPGTGEPTGEGIRNIVALFNNGAQAKGKVFGFWAGHDDLGPIWSRSMRPALGFMQEAKAEFEGKYGAEFGAQIILGGDYG